MQTVDSCVFHFDRWLHFYDYVRITGWFHSPTESLVGVDVVRGDEVLLDDAGEIGLPSPDIGLHPRCRFVVSRLMREPERLLASAVRFRLASGATIVVPVESLDAGMAGHGSGLFARFVSDFQEQPGRSVLEVGSRKRSTTTQRHLFEPHGGYLGVDVVPGENVDRVIDAHRLSADLGRARFDCVFSIEVLEHLAMPWKAVVEMNRVMRPGGIVYAMSAQTCGLHDLPWDFFRFSDAAYRALFNRGTGFEIIETRLGTPMHTVPFLRCSSHWTDIEKAAGFYESEVLARKIAETELDWDVPTSAVVETSYPD